PAMAAYGDMSGDISNVLSQLSLGKRATKGTSAGKLLSSMRGAGAAARESKGGAMADHAPYAPTLPYQVAGAIFNPAMPRGIVARGTAAAHTLTSGGLAALLHPATLAATLPLLAGASPRVLGNLNYALGAANRGARAAGATQKNLGLLGEILRMAGEHQD